MSACISYSVTQMITSSNLWHPLVVKGRRVGGGGVGWLEVKGAQPWVEKCESTFHWSNNLFLYIFDRSLFLEKTPYKKQNKQTKKPNWQKQIETIEPYTIIYNTAKDHGAQVCLPGCIQKTCGRILVSFLLQRGSFTNNSQFALRWARGVIVCQQSREME